MKTYGKRVPACKDMLEFFFAISNEHFFPYYLNQKDYGIHF